MATLGSLIISLEANTAKFEAAMTKAEYTAKKSADAIKSTLLGIGTALAGAFTVKSIEDMIMSVAKMESTLLKTATRLNTSVETLSSFGVMVRKTGMDTEQFYLALTRMEKGMSAAAMKAEEASNMVDEEGNSVAKANVAYNALGLNVEKLRKLPLDQQLMAIAEAFKRNIEPADRVNIAMQLFGKTGSGMINIIKDGEEGIRKYIAEQKDLGIITTEASEKSAEFTKQTKNLDAQWQAFTRQIAEAAIPSLTTLIEKLNEAIKAKREYQDLPLISMGRSPEEKEKILNAIKKYYEGATAGGVSGGGQGGAGGGGYGLTPYEQTQQPPTRPGGISKAGKGGGGDMGLDRMRSIIDTLQKDLSRLTEGSLAEIREWANHTRNEIEKVGRKGAETEEAMALVATVEGKKKEKATEDYYSFIAKESGDNYKQIEADARDWLVKYKGFKDAESNLNAIKNRKIAEEDNRQTIERLSLQASLMNSIATEVPFLSQNLAIKEKLLPLEEIIAKLTLDRAMASLKLNDAQKDELKGLLAVANAAKKYSLEREKLATKGVAGGMGLYALGKKQEGETNIAQATQKQFKDIEKSISTFIGKGIKAILFGQGKVDFAELGKEIASSFIDTAIELAVSKLFEALAMTFLQSILTTVPTEIATATSVATIETTAATTSGGILISAGAALAAEMVAGATQAAAIMTASEAASSLLFFHSGGIVRAHRGWPWLASDEVPIIAQTGERVLSRRQNRDYEAGMTGGRGVNNFYNDNTNITIQPRYPMSRQETEYIVRTRLIPALAKEKKRAGGRYL